MSATVHQIWPRAVPPSRETFAVGRKEPGEETEVVEFKRHRMFCEPLTEEQRRDRGTVWSSTICADCFPREMRKVDPTWTPGPEAA